MTKMKTQIVEVTILKSLLRLVIDKVATSSITLRGFQRKVLVSTLMKKRKKKGLRKST